MVAIAARRSLRRQRGAISVVAAFWLLVAVAALAVIDVGHLFFEKRSLQRVADLAAIAGSQRIAGSCADAQAAANSNAAANGFSTDASGATLNVTCGRWDTSANAAPSFFSTAGAPQNAVLVDIAQTVPYFFLGPSRTMTVEATAQATDVDAFTLSTGLAQLDTQQSVLLNSILGGLLGTQLALSVGDYQGLANARLSVHDLMVQLHATTVNELLGTSVTYQQLTAAMVSALTANGDTADATLLDTLAVAVPGNQSFNVGDGGTSSPGLLALSLADPQSAVDATLSPLDAVFVAAQISRSAPAGLSSAPPIINVDASTALVGVMPASLSLQILQPPALAIGEGPDANGNARTTARTAVITASLKLAPPVFSSFGLNLVVANVTVQALNNPLVLSLTSGEGDAALTDVDCSTTKPDSAVQIDVQPVVAKACLGTDSNCGGPINVVGVYAGSILTGQTKVAQIALGSTAGSGIGWLTVQPPGPQTISFTGVTGAAADGADTQTVNSNQVGSDLSSLTGSVLATVPNALQVTVLNLNLTSGQLTTLLTGVSNALTTTLQPVFASLDDVFVPVLGALGAQVGTATVHHNSLTCGAARIVS